MLRHFGTSFLLFPISSGLEQALNEIGFQNNIYNCKISSFSPNEWFRENAHKSLEYSLWVFEQDCNEILLL